ncbi:MAG: type II toxin-antitoxin system RelE/ParE family toxin [Geminicoccaceae bacterium]
MIKTIRHRGLKRLIERDDASRINPQLERVRRILTLLQGAEQIEDMNLPGFVLHPLTGELRGFWSVRVSGNWRLTFRFEDGHAFDVDLVDYH